MKRPTPEVGALGALAGILAITAAWWALALWPLPGDAPGWLVRTRDVCFGSASTGLPSTAGWMVLIGQPLYMLATLWLISGQAVKRGLVALSASRPGRRTLLASALIVIAGLGAAGARVALAATAAGSARFEPGVATDVPRLDRAAPPLALRDQEGRDVTLAAFRGRPVFVAFAYAHCETVCPLIVHDVLEAQARAARVAPVVLIVTLDPWRDTPTRLASVAARWRLGPDAHLLGGPVALVERALDTWEVGHSRDERTGEITHAAVVFVIDRQGRIAYAAAGSATGAATLADLASRL